MNDRNSTGPIHGHQTLNQGDFASSPGDAVPAAYRGAWRRLRLTTLENADTTTEVHWLQSHYLFADLRIPEGRPDFSNITALEECDSDKLHWLATQGGFAGFLEVYGDQCEWHRQVDFRLSPTRDLAKVQANDSHLTEFGIFENYREDWVREETPDAPMAAFRLLDEPATSPWAGPPRGFLVVVGGLFLFARDRRLTPMRASLDELLADPALSQSERAGLLDCEVSLGRLQNGIASWQIERSTLPFREGQCLLTAGGLEAIGGNLARQPLADGERIWQIFEWSPELSLS